MRNSTPIRGYKIVNSIKQKRVKLENFLEYRKGEWREIIDKGGLKDVWNKATVCYMTL